MDVQRPDSAGAAQSCHPITDQISPVGNVPQLDGLNVALEEMRRGFEGVTERLVRVEQRLGRMDTLMKAEYILHLVSTYQS